MNAHDETVAAQSLLLARRASAEILRRGCRFYGLFRCRFLNQRIPLPVRPSNESLQNKVPKVTTKTTNDGNFVHDG